MSLKSTIASNWNNSRGFKTKRRIVVIESDDWGSTRMPSLQALDRLLKKNVYLDLSSPFDNFDTLASKEDLESLFETLCSVKDKNGNHAKITANCVMANPDFQKMKESGYAEYQYELFTKTLDRFAPTTFPLWQKGMEQAIFHPQFHGREHINVKMWLHSLQQNHLGVRDCFDEGVFSMILDKKEDQRLHVLSAYNYKDNDELAFIAESIREGLNLFFSIFGYQSKSMIAPCFVWDEKIENVAFENGIKYLQGGFFQPYPTFNRERGKRRFMGERNRNNLIYFVRNCSFEPFQKPSMDCVESCLKKIAISFRWNKPAIIGSHRVNYIGSLVKKNREDNLILLEKLLKTIVNLWPDVEFMFSDELGEFIDSQSLIYE